MLAEHDSENVYGLAKISANPEQSKHLETARVRIGKFDIDFVQLRVEEYAENSRIPEVVRILLFDKEVVLQYSFYLICDVF